MSRVRVSWVAAGLAIVWSMGLTRPVDATTMAVKDLPLGSVISVGGMNYVKVNASNVLAATSNFSCPEGQEIAGKKVVCISTSGQTGKYQLYGCTNPVGTMQTWDGCDGLATPTAGSWTQGPCLIDSRDNKTYEIRKYSDGHCWMVDNLAYGGDTALGGTDACVGHPHSGVFGSRNATVVDFTGTNYNTGNVLRGTFGNWDANGNLTTDTSSIATYSYGSCALAYDNSTYKAYQTFDSDQTTVSTEYATYAEALAAVDNDTNRVRPRGYHYDWVAATQNPTAYYASGDNPYVALDSTQGICPDGWRLPTGGTTSAEWRKLFVAIGGRTSDNGDSTERQYLLSRWKTPTSGYSLSGSSALSEMTTYGWWWSPTVYIASHAYALSLRVDAVRPENTNNKSDGYSVRCVKD